METPVKIQHSIRLIVKKKLTKDGLKLWYKIVKQHAPNGTVTSTQLRNADKGLRNVSVIIKKYANGSYGYIVPLTRDLTDKEISKIAYAWTKKFSYDFDIDAPDSSNDLDVDGDIEVPNEVLNKFSVQVAKKMHEKWYKKMVDKGWRYSQKYSSKNKTHPLLRPWDQLPEENKDVDPSIPQLLLDLLYDQGYVVITKSDYEELQKLKVKDQLN